MRKILVWFLLVLLMTSCNIGDESSMYGDFISQIKEYQTNAEQPIDIISLETTKDNFDVNHYFRLCKHIKLMDGWKLDYFYYQEFMRGFPIVYAYEVKNKQMIDYNLFYTYSVDEGLMTQEVPDFILENNFMDYVILDGSEEGYIEYVILELVGPQFLLYWHASYNDQTIVESEHHMRSILKRRIERKNVDREFMKRAKNLNIGPTFSYNGNEVKLSILCFSDWAGFFNVNYYFDTDNKKFIRKETEELLRYDCGILF